MASPARSPSRTWLRRIIITGVVLIVLFGMLGYFAVPPLAKIQLEKILSRERGREVTIESIAVHPFTLEADIHGFVIKERTGDRPALQFETLHVDAEAASIFNRALVVKEIRLVKPFVSVTRFEDGRYSFTDIVEHFAAKPPTEDGPPPRFSINNIEIVDGRIEFDDRPERLKHLLSELHLGVPFVSSLPVFVDINVEPRFEAKLNGDPIKISGRTKPFKDSLETTIDLNLTDLDVARYLE